MSILWNWAQAMHFWTYDLKKNLLSLLERVRVYFLEYVTSVKPGRVYKLV